MELPIQEPQQWLVAFALNGLLIALAQRLPVLTVQGWIHAGILGTLLWGCLGPAGWLAVVAYLGLGTLVTRLGFREKAAAGLAEGRGGRRGPENVWGSAAVGTVLALLTTRISADVPLLLIGFAASFAAKLGDTFGSEIGKRWGRHTVLITSFRPVPPGTEGAISLEGTLASLFGAALMASVMAGLGIVDWGGRWLLVTLVGLAATLLESVIGSTVQGRLPWLSNELVNGLQTLVAALLAIGLAQSLRLA